VKRVLILGGGFGGIAGARRLRELLDPDDEVVLVDRATHFAMGFRKTSEIVGQAKIAEVARPLKALEAFGIDVRQASVTAIDPAGPAADVDGERVEADAMLVALGAETNPSAVPGLAEHGIDWYSFDGVARAAEAVRRDTGRIVIGIFGVPYKCPPAPFELALLLRGALPRTVEIDVFTPLALTIPVIGQVGCEAIEGRLLGQMIGLHREAKAQRVEDGTVVMAGGGEIAFDVLLAVPPHRVPAVVTDAGLAAPGAWIKVDPTTLETAFPGVWAVGDAVAIPMANGNPLPKAGAFADAEGIVAAGRIAARLTGGETDATFDGEGGCFLEVGDGEAMMVRGKFLATPAPDVELTRPSAAFLEEKRRFEQQRLDAWFGAP
jgi:sulfide:quinone oxidoreductase